MPTLSAAPGRLWIDTVSPTVNDDEEGGYEIGNWWLDETTNTLYQCLGVDNGAAVWRTKPSEIPGTFTPVLQFGGATTGITYAINGQDGKYKRVGSLVYLNIFIQLSSKGSAQGNAVITGLPFAAESGIKPKGLTIIKTNLGLSSGYNHMYGRVNAGATQVNLMEASDNTANAMQNVTDVLFTNTSIIQVDGFYFI